MLKYVLLAVFILLSMNMGIASESWSYEGGIIAYKYDPFNNGLGATVWIWNAEPHPVPIDGIYVSLESGWDYLGSKELKSPGRYLGPGETMQVAVGKISNPGAVTLVRTYGRDTAVRYWDLEHSHSLVFDECLLRKWETHYGSHLFLDQHIVKGHD